MTEHYSNPLSTAQTVEMLYCRGMWLLIIPVISLIILAAGVTLIIWRRKNHWYLWTGIGLVVLYLLSLPVVLPFTVLAIIGITGGSFGP